MKKILTGVIGCVFLFVIFSFLFPMSTVKSTVNLYWILNHRPFVTYVDCERVLNRAASKDTVYADVSRYMDSEHEANERSGSRCRSAGLSGPPFLQHGNMPDTKRRQV